MDFIQVIEKVTSQLDANNIRYALIGGFAMALRGVQRATVDLRGGRRTATTHRLGAA